MPETTWTRDESVIFSEISDGHAALLDTDGGVYYSLNPSGAMVWQALAQPRTVSELARVITETYDVADEVARRDVETLLGELGRRGLVEET